MTKKIFLIPFLFLLMAIPVFAVVNPSYTIIDDNASFVESLNQTIISWDDYIFTFYKASTTSHSDFIMMASSYDAGLTWSTKKILTNPTGDTINRFDVIKDTDNYFHLVFFDYDPTRNHYYSYSTNLGLTWSTPELVTNVTGTYGYVTIDVNNDESNVTKRAMITAEQDFWSRISGSWVKLKDDIGIKGRSFLDSTDKNIYWWGSAGSGQWKFFRSSDGGANWGFYPLVSGLDGHDTVYDRTDRNILGTGTEGTYQIFNVFQPDTNSFMGEQLILNDTTKRVRDLYDDNSTNTYLALVTSTGNDINKVIYYNADYGDNWGINETYDLNYEISNAKWVKNIDILGILAIVDVNDDGTDDLVFFDVPAPTPNLVNTVTESSDPAWNDVNFFIYNELRASDTNYLVTTADCNVTWRDTNYSMPYNSVTQRYTWEFIEDFPNTYPYQVLCDDVNYNASSTDGNLTVLLSPSGYLTITDIENVTHAFDQNKVVFTPTTETSQIIYKVDSNYVASFPYLTNIKNSLNDFRQYYVYVANQSQYDNNTWVFSDLLTYGSSANYDDPVQKKWDNSLGKYVYSFKDTLSANEIKYYKLVYRYPMRYWNSLTHDDWWHQYVPQNYDVNGISTDRYSVSTYSNIFSRYKLYLPYIDSNYTYSYELQFNAHADSTIDLTVGVYNDSNYGFVSGKTVSLNSIETRYSIDLIATDVNHNIYIKSNSSTANNIYFSNVVLVQRAYFMTRLELLQENYESLPAFISDINGTSYNYIDEGVPFRFKTEIYDRDGKIRNQRVEVYAYGENDTNKVVQHDVNITSYDIENWMQLDGLIDGVILVTEGEDYRTRTDVLVKVILIDSNNSEFVETGKWFKLHEYPFHHSDFFLQTREDQRVINSAPKGKFFIQSRIPSNIEDIEMFIYYGNYYCPAWRLNESTSCTTGSTATDTNLAFRYKFYRNDSCDEWDSLESGCFTCNDPNGCNFEYNLENLFHYAGEGYHTTFTVMHFNTTDTNKHYSRTLYEIGQQSLDITTELQGLDSNAYSGCDGNFTVAGSVLHLFTTYTNVYNDLVDNDIIKLLLASGRISYQDVSDYAYHYCGDSYTDCLYWGEIYAIASYSNPINDFMGFIGCTSRFSQSTNVKITAKLYSNLLDDFHSYEDIYFKITPCNDDNSTCDVDSNQYKNSFYPVMTYYDIDTGANIFVWNTILYDSNAEYLTDGIYYRIDFYGEDGTYRTKDVNTHATNDGNLLIVIDNSFTPSIDKNEQLRFLPLVLSGASEDQLYLRSFINTRNKFLDKIEFIIYTDYSSFDVLKSDKENQIIRFNLDAEEILKLKNEFDFNAFRVFNKFKYERQNVDVLSACTSGSGIASVGTGAGLGLIFGTALVATGIGSPAGFVILGTTVAGGMLACGSQTVVSWAVGETYNMQLDQNYNFLYNSWIAGEYKELDMIFEDLHVNDFEELMEEHDLSEEEVSEYTIINELAKKEEQAHDKPLKVTVGGKKHEFENVLVGRGTLHENIRSTNLKIRINAYYDYYSKSLTQNLEISALEVPPSNWLANWNQLFISWFNSFPMLILGIVLLLVLIVFIKRGFSSRSG